MKPILIIALLFLLFSSTTSQDPIRKWTSADGSQFFLGQFVSSNGIDVTIMRDGEPIAFPLARLSAEDQQLIREKIKPQPIHGQWLWESVGITFTLREKGGMVEVERKVRTGEVEKEEMILVREGARNLIKPKEPRLNGDYLALESDGTLRVMDNDGEIATAGPLEQEAPETANDRQEGFTLLADQQTAILENVKAQGATDAVIKIKEDSINLAFSVPFGTTKEEAKQIGENFVRLTMTLSNDENPNASLVKGRFSYMVGAMTPDQKWLVMGQKTSSFSKVIW